jgi:phosphoglucomutase
MTYHELAGKPAPSKLLIDVSALRQAYYDSKPDADNPTERVSFGTSGHRGCSLKNSFNQAHIWAISQAICEFRQSKHIDGPLYLGMDTHALSKEALMSAVEVFAANGVHTAIQPGQGYTPTPVISHAILSYNKERRSGLADGVIITPSHNPPEDGGFKYNSPTGGPADIETTTHIQNRANEILKNGLQDAKRIDYRKAHNAGTILDHDYIAPYVNDLANVIDMKTIAAAGIKIGIDPLGGSSIDFWEPIAKTYGLDITVVNTEVDPTFSFMTVDRDGKIRMDCSSPFAMAGLIKLKDRFDIAAGNDPDSDRHGIVTKSSGLMNPNHYLSAAIWYLFQHRPTWGADASIGKTLVSSSMIDRIAKTLGRTLSEVPVGFKWFVDGLLNGTCGFGGEESAGASFLRRDGTVWTTDKDGIILDLLAAEITAVTKQDPGQMYRDLEGRFGKPLYERIDVRADREQKNRLKNLSPKDISTNTLAGEKILAKLTHAPGNNAPIGGLKVVAENGWFAVRPSGTESAYKIYAESFSGESHLKQLQTEAKAIVTSVFRG